MRRAAILCALLACACGGKSGSDVVPRLPGSGTANLPDPVAPDRSGEEGDPWSGRKDLIESPRPEAPEPLDFSAPKRFELRSGLEVVVVEQPTLPTVGFQLAVRAGQRDAPLDKAGLESFAAALLTRGTRQRSADEISKQVEQAGAQLAATAGYETTSVSCAVSSRRLDTCLALMADIAAQTVFPEDAVEDVREKLMAQVAEQRESAAKLATVHFENLLFGDDHPRGRPMSEHTIEAISRDDLLAWHKAHFRPNNAVLVVVGDVRAEALRPKLSRALARWRRRRTPKRPTFEEPKVSGIQVRLVDRPDAQQAQVRVGRPGVSTADPDYHAALVGAAALGDEGGLLGAAARARFGKDAAASASLDRGFGHRGAMMAAVRVKSRDAVPAARLLMTQIGKLQAGPSEAQIERTAARIAGRHGRRLQSSLELAGALATAATHGVGQEFVRQFAHRVGSVGRDDVREAAAARFGTQDLVVVLFGPAAQIEPALAEAGWVFEKVGYREPASKVERERLEKARTAPVNPAAEKRARAILDKALAAKGGKKRLSSIKTFQWEGDATVDLPAGEIRAHVEKRYVAPDKLRLDLHLLDVNVKVTTVVDGEKAWAAEKSPQGERTIDLPASELAAARAQLWRDQDFVLLRHLEEGTKVRPLPDVSIAGKAHHAIRLESGDGQHQVTLILDKKSLLLVGMEYSDQGMKAEERLAGYKKVNGIRVAHERKTESPQMKLDAKLSRVQIDAKVDPSLFVKPE